MDLEERLSVGASLHLWRLVSDVFGLALGLLLSLPAAWLITKLAEWEEEHRRMHGRR